MPVNMYAKAFIIYFRAAIQLKILMAINRAIKIFNRNYSWIIAPEQEHKFIAQNNIVAHDITSIARCKCQQNVPSTEIKIKTSN